MNTGDESFDVFSSLPIAGSRKNSSAENLYTRVRTLDPYPMSVRDRKRGLALIFAHETFLITNNSRSRSDVDYDRLKALLEQLNFEVMICLEHTKGNILDKLHKVSKLDHSNHECLAIFVMTHGCPGMLAAYDTFYKVSDLWRFFTKIKCPSLKGKPKLFFIQACRGYNADAGIYMKLKNANPNQPSPAVRHTTDNYFFGESPVDEYVEIYETPDESDFLIAYSTIPDHYSYRELSSGSWFIQDLCDILEKFARKYDLLTLLTFVVQQVAVDRVSNSPDDFMKHDKKQIPSIVNTLTRPLYFYPEEAEEVPENLEYLDTASMLQLPD